MTLYGSLLTRGIGMGKVDQCFAQVFQLGQPRELGVVVCRGRLEGLIPVSELAAVICFCWSFFDTTPKNTFVFAVFCILWRSTQLLGKNNILYAKQSEISIAIECLSTDNLPSGEQPFVQCIADASIQRPSVFEEFLLNKRGEIEFSRKS